MFRIRRMIKTKDGKNYLKMRLIKIPAQILVKLLQEGNSWRKESLKKRYKELWRLYALSSMHEMSFDHEIDIYYRWLVDGNFFWGG